MADLSSYEERQEDEVEFLQAFFPNPGDFQDLRQNDKWKVSFLLRTSYNIDFFLIQFSNLVAKVRRPPEIVLTLVPQKSMGGSAKDQHPISVKLHAKDATDYPDSAPKVWLEEPQGLTSDQVKDLEKELRKLAKERVGEVRGD